MTSRRARDRPTKSSCKNNLHSMVDYFPKHIVRKSRTGTKTIAVKTWHRSGSEDLKTLLWGLMEKESSLPQWIRKKKSIDLMEKKSSLPQWIRKNKSSEDKETLLRWLMEKKSSPPQWIRKKKSIDLMEKKSSLPQWMRRKRSIDPKSNEQLKNISRTSNDESSLCPLSESSLVPWMAKIVIPGPIPDLDSFSDHVSFLQNFFVDIPKG